MGYPWPSLRQPIWKLLGGAVQPRVRIYNTCGGPGYGTLKPGTNVVRHPGWPGYGDEGVPGKLQDNWSAYHAAGDLAEELVAEGIMGMKSGPSIALSIRKAGWPSRAPISKPACGLFARYARGWVTRSRS